MIITRPAATGANSGPRRVRGRDEEKGLDFYDSDRCRPDRPCRIHPAVSRASEAMRTVLAASNFASLRDGAS